jgi:hypothetical protein
MVHGGDYRSITASSGDARTGWQACRTIPAERGSTMTSPRRRAEVDEQGATQMYFDNDGNGTYEMWAEDRNGDGFFDRWLVDGEGDGYFEQDWRDDNGDGVVDWSVNDFDLDGYAETIGIDRTGDGIADQHQYDTNLDGTVDVWFDDWNQNGVFDVYEQPAPSNVMTITAPQTEDPVITMTRANQNSNDDALTKLWNQMQIQRISDSQAASINIWTRGY